MGATLDLAHADALPTSLDKLGVDNLLLTLGAEGMVLVTKDKQITRIPTMAREVFDVSGAGDTVVATLAVCLAGKMPVERAMRFANIAAGLVVAKVGTATVTTSELRAEVLRAEARNSARPFSKIMTLDEAKNHRSLWKSSALSVGFTNGCFDLLHPGHISLIAQAKASCDRLIVALNGDSSVRRLKGEGRPVQSVEARSVIMAALGDVDAVIVFDEDTPEAVIHELRPDVLIKGADYTEDSIVGAAFVRSLGGAVVLADLTPSQSTSALIARSRTPAS
jgi:D-beta-D-heptose 7-phosphate kinase/D-beta-D-heptose 1-phosphate adenosyltransferase